MKINLLRQQVLTDTHSAMLIFNELNIRYLSGFSGHAATLLITDKVNYLLTDYRYLAQATSEAIGFKIICRDRQKQSLAELLISLLNQENCQQLFFESEHISVAKWQSMSKEISEQSSITQVTAMAGQIEKLRMVKTEQEIASIRQAAAIADQALSNILPLITLGITERELANELEYHMAKLGSQALSFATILLFGERSALPHGIPSERALKQGDLILIDFGAVINGYRSDMTRTFVFGKASEKQRQVYQLVQHAQQAAIDKVTAGVSAATLQNTADEILQQSDYKDFTGESIGHGLGLQLHEPPFLSPSCTTSIVQGCVFTIEPGIYIPNWGGIRIEDDVVLTPNGLEILTQSPKELTEL
ncbi:M24 family metallopeptidase [Thalassotalea sp. PLHSN55]|uniref:M24 family metallopeptidase n=1 Tax=Thalassotalea sp. PLHSN55 TaxID=3435888 RepID=UPI003F83F754